MSLSDLFLDDQLASLSSRDFRGSVIYYLIGLGNFLSLSFDLLAKLLVAL